MQALLRGLRLGRADRLPAADLVDHPLAPLEDADPLPRPALPRAHVRRPRQRPLRPARERLRRARVRRRRARGDGRDGDRARGARLALAGRAARAAPRRRAAGAGRRRRVHLPGRAARRAAPERAAATPGTRSSTPTRAGRSTTATTGSRDYRGFLEFFFSQMFNEPHSTKPIEDCVGWGLETTPETLDRDAARRERSSADDARDLAGRVRCPVLVIQGSEDAITGPGRGIALAEATGGELVMLEGSGHGPHVRDPVKVNLLLREFVVPAARRRRAGCAAGRAASARSTSRRRSASATPSATPRSPTSCASCTPTSRSTGSPSTRSRRCSRRAASAIHPGERAPGERVAATSRASRPSTTSTASRRSGGWTRSCSPTSWSSTTSSASEDYDLWIGDEAWELDYYLHENPEQKRAAYVWLTDFVGWLPMPDGGDARGVPDRRLQRRDDRAHRALPARARPRRVRRQRRRHRPGRRSARTCRRSATGRRSTTTSPATSPASTPATWAIAGSSATATTSASASSPSAARASAPTCCGA